MREREESFRELVEQADEMIYRTDVRGRFTLCNPALTRFLKYSGAELLGLQYWEVINRDERKAAREFYLRQLYGD